MPKTNSYDYSDYEKFGMKNNVARNIYGGWLIFVVICTLLGDSIILVASIKYKAFKLHRIIVALIQHIAVCDLLHASSSALPIVVSVFYNSGGSSKILNQVRFFISYYVNSLSASLIAAISLGKLCLLRYPLRARSWQTRQAHKICAGIWMASLSNPALHLVIDKEDVIFDHRIYACAYMYVSNAWKILLPIVAFIVLFVPNCIIIVSTVLLLKEARKSVRGTNESLRWLGIMTVVLTAAVFSVSFLPITVYYIAEPFVEKGPEPGPFYLDFYRVAISVLFFNVLANFFVYSLTVASFRTFLKTQFQQKVSLLSNKISPGGKIPVEK